MSNWQNLPWSTAAQPILDLCRPGVNDPRWRDGRRRGYLKHIIDGAGLLFSVDYEAAILIERAMSNYVRLTGREGADMAALSVRSGKNVDIVANVRTWPHWDAGNGHHEKTTHLVDGIGSQAAEFRRQAVA